MSRVIGLYNIKRDCWDKLIYIHSVSGGGVCVNGEQVRVYLHRAGEEFLSGDMDYAIVLPRNARIPEGELFAVNSGECLLKVADKNEISVQVSGFVGVSSRFEFWRSINAAVLTISDKCSSGEREDTAGAVLADLAEAIGAAVILRSTVPDERASIAAVIRDWADNKDINLILTTGGTGLSKRDVTPEALMDIQERVVPGFGEIMRSHTMLYTPRSFLTRSLAVVRGNALVIAFPGSETAVRECFEAIVPALRHGVEILCGWDAECGHHHK